MLKYLIAEVTSTGPESRSRSVEAAKEFRESWDKMFDGPVKVKRKSRMTRVLEDL
jgi:hypothetical protein